MAEENALQKEQMRQMIADSQRSIQEYFDGQRDHQAQGYRLNAQQLDNLAGNTELGKRPATLSAGRYAKCRVVYSTEYRTLLLIEVDIPLR